MIAPRQYLAQCVAQWLAGIEHAGRPILLDIEPNASDPSDASEVSIRVYADETSPSDVARSMLTDSLEIDVITPFEDYATAEDLLDAVRYPLIARLTAAGEFTTPTANRGVFAERYQCWKIRTSCAFRKEAHA